MKKLLIANDLIFENHEKITSFFTEQCDKITIGLPDVHLTYLDMNKNNILSCIDRFRICKDKYYFIHDEKQILYNQTFRDFLKD